VVVDVEKHHQHQHLQKEMDIKEQVVAVAVPEEMVQVMDLVVVDLVLL
tara:strand:+ start:26 stop:169 length:144 start_codon:yes stop_codon:yes gene_type:complete